MILLDESHCSAHSYADLGLIALDIFTCGETDPSDILQYIREELDLGIVTTVMMPRFAQPHSASDVVESTDSLNRLPHRLQSTS